jgi:hypothetical protein
MAINRHTKLAYVGVETFCELHFDLTVTRVTEGKDLFSVCHSSLRPVLCSRAGDLKFGVFDKNDIKCHAHDHTRLQTPQGVIDANG